MCDIVGTKEHTYTGLEVYRGLTRPSLLLCLGPIERTMQYDDVRWCDVGPQEIQNVECASNNIARSSYNVS